MWRGMARPGDVRQDTGAYAHKRNDDAMSNPKLARPDFTLSPLRVAMRPVIESKQRGDIVTYEEIRESCGLTQSAWDALLRKGFRSAIRAEIAERTKGFAVPVEGVGYRIGTSPDAVRDENRRRLRARNQIARAVEELQTAENKDLSMSEQSERDRSVRSLAGIAAEIQTERKLNHKALKNSAPAALPRPKTE